GRAASAAGSAHGPAESRYRRPDGSYAAVLDRACILRDETDRPRRVLGAMLDLTERKRALEGVRESEEKFRGIVETAHEGIWILDESARATFVNRRMAELLGYAPEEVLGRSKWDFVFDEDVPAVRALWERRRAGSGERADVRFRHKCGAEVWTLMSARPVFDERGAFRGALDMFSDVTDRRRAEEALKEADRRKDDFLAMLGHELRNP